MRVVRAALYLYFSAAAGLFVAGVIAFALAQTSSRFVRLPGAGGVLWLVCAAFIALMLVFGQWDHFGERLRVVRWVLLCAVSTFLAVAGFTLGSLSSF